MLATTILAQNSCSYIKQNNEKNINTYNKFNYKLNIGTSYLQLNNYNLFSNYISPELSYKVNDKLNLSLGLLVLNNNLYPNKYNNEILNPSPNYMRINTYFYANAEYLINPNLRIRTEGLFDLNTSKDNKSFKYANFGIDYKFNNNSSISIDINYNNINPQLYYNDNSLFNRNSFYMNNSFDNLFMYNIHNKHNNW